MSSCSWLPALLSLALASTAAAQQPAPAAPGGRADPLDPQAAVPPAVAPPGLRRYRPAPMPDVENWRDANDRVARIGGWRTYLREAQQPAPLSPVPAPTGAAAPAAAASSLAAEPRHHGHR